MKIEQIVILGAAAYFLLKDQFNQIGYGVKSVKVVKRSGNTIDLAISISVNNGSKIPLKVDGFIGTLSKGGVHISDLVLINGTSIEPGQEKDILLGAKVSFAGAIASIFNSLNEFLNDKNIPVTVKGKIMAIGREIPVNFTTDLW